MTICRKVTQSVEGGRLRFYVHGPAALDTGYGPIKFTSRGELPPGIKYDQGYWVKQIHGRAFRISGSKADAENSVVLDLQWAGDVSVPLWVILP